MIYLSEESINLVVGANNEYCECGEPKGYKQISKQKNRGDCENWCCYKLKGISKSYSVKWGKDDWRVCL